MLVGCIVPDTLGVDDSIVCEGEDARQVSIVTTVKVDNLVSYHVLYICLGLPVSDARVGRFLTAIIFLMVVGSKLLTVVAATHQGPFTPLVTIICSPI